MANFTSERIKSILFYPAYEWKIISAEKRTLKEDFSVYALNLILFGAISQAIGSFFFVRNVLDIDAYRFSFPLVKAIFYLLMQIFTVIILTFFVNGLSGKIAQQKDFIKSGKLVIYGLTPMFLCYIISNLSSQLMLALIPAFYSLWLFAKGLPVMLKVDRQKIPGFLFIIAISILGINYLLDIGFDILTSVIFPDIFIK